MDAGALTRTERIAFASLSIFVALTRWPAISRTVWDWDEALFALALRDYDVTMHHPHPPGFPLFIAAAKLIPLDAFHALQFVTVLSSLFVFPAMFFLARELRATPFASMSAGLLLAFFPNVWFFGGTAFSDVPSMVLALVACALLLRGRRGDAALLAGCVVLGIAAGFRPQNLIIGCAPFLAAFVSRRRTALLGGFVIVLIIAASYGTAASLSGGWSAYRETLARHERYIREVDSFLAPLRPGLVQVADDFFFWPYRAPVINVAVTLLAFVGFVRKRPWLVIAIYAPFLLFAWLYLDFHSASRFSIGYMPLYAMLAAEGIPRRGGAIVLGAFVAIMIIWTWPALRVVHTTLSPPVAAIEALPREGVVYVDERLAAHAELLIPNRERRVVKVTPGLVLEPNTLLLREGASIAPGARSFKRERARLEEIARARYFETSVVPASSERTRSSVDTTSSRASRP
ncbi:MAG TPA: hypothetical protein VJZ00_07815 [Thermoanaerobaculia bacterium]|nr:hypothetical protein [Thermoanaerobaculia bacterium]